MGVPLVGGNAKPRAVEMVDVLPLGPGSKLAVVGVGVDVPLPEPVVGVPVPVAGGAVFGRRTNWFWKI